MTDTVRVFVSRRMMQRACYPATYLRLELMCGGIDPALGYSITESIPGVGGLLIFEQLVEDGKA